MLSSCRSASPAAAGSSLGRRSVRERFAISRPAYSVGGLLAGGLLAPSTMRMSCSYQKPRAAFRCAHRLAEDVH
jgi:hypothetical protein